MDGYVKVRSWHIIGTYTRVPGRAITLCGLTVPTSGADGVDRTSPTLPAEKSCESCLRISQRRADGSEG